MNLKKIRKTSKELELEITDEDETILNPISVALYKNKDLDFAEYISNHPTSNKRILYIRMKKGKPEDALKKAVKELEKEVETFIKNFEKCLPKS
jgi:DNA-directed RNA polymerase subunit L